MTLKLFLKITGVLFAARAIFMAYYFVYGTKVWVGSWMVPGWIYLAGIVIDGLLAYWALKFAQGRK